MTYRWLYTDVAAGDLTAVVIFMWSPVFSARSRATAVNVALYRGGKRMAWAFSEYDTGFGRSSIDGTPADGVHIEVAEQTPFMKRPLQLQIDLQAVAPSGPEVTLHGSHQWRALLPRANATLRFNGQTLTGIGYHDSNWGAERLDECWTWTRQHGPKQTWVHYQLRGHAQPHLLFADAHESRLQAGQHAAQWRRSGWGLAYPQNVQGLATGQIIESSPFYARLHAHDAGVDRLTEVAHFGRFNTLACRWMPYFRSRAVTA